MTLIEAGMVPYGGYPREVGRVFRVVTVNSCSVKISLQQNRQALIKLSKLFGLVGETFTVDFTVSMGTLAVFLKT